MSLPPTASDPPPLPASVPIPTAQQYNLAYQRFFEQKRLHPATIIVQVVRFVRRIAIFVFVLIFLRFTGQQADRIELIVTALGGLSIIDAVVKYITFRYSVRDGALHVTSGLIQRQIRTIPLERIQNINLKQEIAHRLLGVADVRIETASGGEAEAELSVVDLREAEAIRSALARGALPAEATGGPPEHTVYQASIIHLLIAGATQNRLGTLLAGALGLAVTINQFAGGGKFRAAARWVEHRSQHIAVPGWLPIALGLVALVLLGWMASIAMTVVSRFGFKLTLMQGQLQRSFGLVTRHQSIFPVGRVQVLRITAPLLQRWVGLCRISAETAGSFREEKKESSGTNELCPIIERSRAAEVSKLVLPGYALDEVSLESIHPLGRRRAFVRTFFVIAIAVALLAWFVSPLIWFGMFIAAAAAWVYAVIYFRVTKFATDHSHLTVQSGIWIRIVEVVPWSKIQASFVKQSPLQRRLGLTTFEAMTASSAFGRSVKIRDVSLETAVSLQDRAGKVVADTAERHPPGET